MKQGATKTLTVDEQFRALDCDASDPLGPEWRTRAQLQEIWGRSEGKARVRIRRLMGEGKLERCMGYVNDVTGRAQYVPHYKVKEGE